ncbi:archease [Candidatus Babeliales bacterium]|nr:archease [Candidatus Babeliales bacterium]
MRKHELLPHVADVRLNLEGDSLKELFIAAIEGMAELSKKELCKEFKLEEQISISAKDATILLIDFLSEILTLQHVNKAIYCKIDFSSLSETSLNAMVYGCSTDSFDEDIKAVTYHEAEIKKNKKGFYETVIIFDI